jgi:hypothetical protein
MGLTSVVPEALARRVLEGRTDLPKLIELPKLLRLYADHLEAVSRFTAHHAPKAPKRFRADLEFALVKYVKTGRRHLPEIATLFEAAAFIARASNEVIDARNLRMRYSRHSRRKK